MLTTRSKGCKNEFITNFGSGKNHIKHMIGCFELANLFLFENVDGYGRQDFENLENLGKSGENKMIQENLENLESGNFLSLFLHGFSFV